MARAFTTQFRHHNKAYTAVVTQTDSSVSFYVPDESLHHVMPQGRFSYNPQQGLPVDTTSLSPLQNLVLDIFTAVELQNQRQATTIS